MARSVDPLVVGRVIGEVVDMFVPSVEMTVKYGSRQIGNGCELKPSTTTMAPRVQLNGDPSSFFTLVMTDPDAPSPSEPAMREWLHWIVADIPGTSDATKGKQIVPYMGPKPPIGIHRYIFVLFKQPGPMQVFPPHARNNFNTRKFSEEYGFGAPHAVVYFNAQKEPGPRRR